MRENIDVELTIGDSWWRRMQGELADVHVLRQRVLSVSSSDSDAQCRAEDAP